MCKNLKVIDLRSCHRVQNLQFNINIAINLHSTVHISKPQSSTYFGVQNLATTLYQHLGR